MPVHANFTLLNFLKLTWMCNVISRKLTRTPGIFPLSSGGSSVGSGSEFSNTDVETDGIAYANEEVLIEAAHQHVMAATAMRNKINERTQESQVDHQSMSYDIVVDYAQNMDLPQFGSQQPGETYYYSPKNVYVFGVCNVTVQPTQLYAYCYEEENGKKGGNNVASLIMLHLEKQGLLPMDVFNSPIKGKRLTIACNNCGGQNKNNMVIRMANYLVERGHFGEVEVLFFVKGHTKNACNRCFNIMKLTYHNKNIYTFNSKNDPDSLIKTIGKCTDVHPVVAGSSHGFRNWDAKLNRLYTRLVDGLIKKNHTFRVTEENGATIIQTKINEGEGVEAVDQDLRTKKKMTNQERKEILEEEPELIAPPGLNRLKQVDLWKKWRPLLPERFRDITCPKPPPEIMNSVSQERREKAKAQHDKKKAAATREIE